MRDVLSNERMLLKGLCPWLCQLKLYPNPVSCISGLTTGPFSPSSFVSSFSLFSLFPHFLYSTSHGNDCSLYLLTGSALLHENLSLINEDLRLPTQLCSLRVASKEVGVNKVPGGVYGTGRLTKWSAWPAMSAVELNETAQSKNNSGLSLSRAITEYAFFKIEREKKKHLSKTNSGKWKHDLAFWIALSVGQTVISDLPKAH